MSGDAEVAQFILSEIANGNPVYMKALGQVAHNTIQPQSGHVLSQVASEVDAQIKDEFFKENWEKIKNMFSKKQAAQSETEEAVITRLLNAEVASYIKAQDAKLFDSLKQKLKQGLSKYMGRSQVDDGADDEVDSDDSDSDSDSDSDDDDISNEDLDHDGVADYLQKSKISAQEIDEAINRYVFAQAESGDAFFNFSKLKNKLAAAKNKFTGVKDQINGLKSMIAPSQEAE